MVVKNFDRGIIVSMLLLSGFGSAIIGSVAPGLVTSQIVFYLLGLILFVVFSQIDYKIYASAAKLIYLVSVALLLLTLIIGFESRGSTRWISLFGFRLQFSEVLKPFILASLASFMTKSWFKASLLAVLPMFLIFKQPDLGSALVYVFGFASMIFVSGINVVYILLAIGGGVVLLPLGWHFLAEYQRARIVTFLNPSSDPLGASYNAIQALIAVGSGQLFGWGLGRGTQSQLLFLPEQHTDFVFASLSEELGFFGAGTILIIYFVLIWRMLDISAKSPDFFGRVLGVGLSYMFLAQVFINIGMNLGIVPVTGITLPLVSYGGSSVLATFISLGIVQNIRTSCLRSQNLVQSPLYGFLNR
jgi:rod shape determining protein RodA